MTAPDLKVERVNGTLVVVPERTNGYESFIPTHVTDAIDAHRRDHPDADRAPWAAVVAFCTAGSGCADIALSPVFVSLYVRAVDEYAGDAEIQAPVSLAGGGVDGRDIPAPECDMDEKTEELRWALRSAVPEEAWQ